MSRVDPLIAALVKTGADELRLVAGQRIHILKEGKKQEIGREPVSAQAIDSLAGEMLTPAQRSQLQNASVTQVVARDGVRFDVMFSQALGTQYLAIRKTKTQVLELDVEPPKSGPVVDAQAPRSQRADPRAEPRPDPTRALLEPTRMGATVDPRVDPMRALLEPTRFAPETPRPVQVAPQVAAPPPQPAYQPPPQPAYQPPPQPAYQPAPQPAYQPPASPASVLELEVPPSERVAPATLSSNRAIDQLLYRMIASKASDLHLSSGAPPVLRVHGEVEFLTDQPLLTSDAVELLLRDTMPERSTRDFKERNDADYAYEVEGLARFRVNVFRDRKGVGAVLRQIPIEIITAEKLGLPKAALDLCYLSKGLVVVTGPTGSGKSTTLAGMVDYINKNRTDHIITIEDPVEFVHPNIRCLVNQREIGAHTMSFKNALRAALREDPDIVLVGEMRDLETVAIAIETAETGHLVFGTLHTTTAVSTIDRIIDQFPTDQQAQIRVMLSEALKGVIAQVLCKKIGGGRAAALEILIGTHAVASLVREGKTFQIPSIMQTSRNIGMVTMNESLFSLVNQKLVDPKEAYIKAVDKSGLLAMFKNAGVPSPF